MIWPRITKAAESETALLPPAAPAADQTAGHLMGPRTPARSLGSGHPRWLPERKDLR